MEIIGESRQRLFLFPTKKNGGKPKTLIRQICTRGLETIQILKSREQIWKFMGSGVDS